MNLDEKLERVVQHHEKLSEDLARHPDPGSADYTRLAKEYADLGPVVEAVAGLQAARKEAEDLKALLAEDDADPEMRELAAAELEEIETRLPGLEQEVKIMLLPKDVDDERNAILEVRAGTGGDEAALFAAELYRMFHRFAEHNSWRMESLSESETGLGGLKEASVLISGPGAYARLIDLPDPDSEPVDAPEITALMAELRFLRAEMLQSAERLGVIEKRLKGSLAKFADPVE